jgi:hypothetical protein
MSDAIFIVGYYRSGTSALSGALQRLGVKFYNEADRNEHNPLGFYEIPELIELDVKLFNRLGIEWTDVRGLPADFAGRADVAGSMTQLDGILRRRFDGAPLWGLKHPHLCRTLPLYERAARQAGHHPHVVHICRDPWTAAASQQHKNGLSRAHALLLWMGYVTAGEKHARHLPRSWLTYQDLLKTPAVQLRRIAQDLAIESLALAPENLREATAFLTKQLNRSVPAPQEGLLQPLRRLVSETWAAIQARDFAPALWDGFAAETANLVGFLNEIGGSRGRVIPSFGQMFAPVAVAAPAAMALRPPERLDAGARLLLQARAAQMVLPRVCVIVVAPMGRAAAVTETIDSLRAQWRAPAVTRIIAAEAVSVDGCETIACGTASGEATAKLCELLREMSGTDYVAVLNAGDTVMPDACLRFALAAAGGADIIYCDEIVPRDGGPWIRHKPGWDVTRLRQSAYLGDWVWYGRKILQDLGGFDAMMAGAEEYDFQLRAAAAGANVLRLPEALFTRSPQSRRDDIGAESFCARAAAAVTAQLARCRIPAVVQNRQHLGLFHHLRDAPDPGTTLILLCDGAEIPALDVWLQGLLASDGLSGPIILAGGALTETVQKYLTAVTQQTDALEGKILAVPPRQNMLQGEAIGLALTLVKTPLVGILDVRAHPSGPHWAEALRSRLADPGVALVAARGLVALGAGQSGFSVQGPIVIGAETRLGAGHLSDDPGPGGWLMVDQEASAVAPPAILGRTAALAACAVSELAGDAFWIDVCVQLRLRGSRVVWTPDVSFIAPAEAFYPDTAQKFREGTAAARRLPAADRYHHPALSLHGNLLAAELRAGLVAAAPAVPGDLLLSGAPAEAGSILNAARALRMAGVLEAGWVPEPIAAADFLRRAPAHWVRINPADAGTANAPYTAVFCAAPQPGQKPAIAGAAKLMATSPLLAALVQKHARPGQKVILARPALAAGIWETPAAKPALNTKPRVLWIDEGMAPGWLAPLISETLDIAAWIVVQRAGTGGYAGAVTQLAPPADEAGWARALGEVAPNILVRPADNAAHADMYHALLAAAAGCHLLVDERLDMFEALRPVRLANRPVAWQRALRHAIEDLPATLAAGAQARAAALALPGVEILPPLWAGIAAAPATLTASAAE